MSKRMDHIPPFLNRSEYSIVGAGVVRPGDRVIVDLCDDIFVTSVHQVTGEIYSADESGDSKYTKTITIIHGDMNGKSVVRRVGGHSCIGVLLIHV